MDGDRASDPVSITPVKRRVKSMGPHGSPSDRIKIYTKSGDKGESCLYNGERRSKDDSVFHALGDIDELNSAIGIAKEHVKSLDTSLTGQLDIIQERLLDIGSYVATPPSSSARAQKRVEFEDSNVSMLEDWIDDLSAQLPPLTNFILPSGGLAAANLHLCRAICRRAERSLTQLYAVLVLERPPTVMMYVNRLSDYLFMAARQSAQLSGEEEFAYRKA